MRTIQSIQYEGVKVNKGASEFVYRDETYLIVGPSIHGHDENELIQDIITKISNSSERDAFLNHGTIMTPRWTKYVVGSLMYNFDCTRLSYASLTKLSLILSTKKYGEGTVEATLWSERDIVESPRMIRNDRKPIGYTPVVHSPKLKASPLVYAIKKIQDSVPLTDYVIGDKTSLEVYQKTEGVSAYVRDIVPQRIKAMWHIINNIKTTLLVFPGDAFGVGACVATVLRRPYVSGDTSDEMLRLASRLHYDVKKETLRQTIDRAKEKKIAMVVVLSHVLIYDITILQSLYNDGIPFVVYDSMIHYPTMYKIETVHAAGDHIRVFNVSWRYMLGEYEYIRNKVPKRTYSILMRSGGVAVVDDYGKDLVLMYHRLGVPLEVRYIGENADKFPSMLEGSIHKFATVANIIMIGFGYDRKDRAYIVQEEVEEIGRSERIFDMISGIEVKRRSGKDFCIGSVGPPIFRDDMFSSSVSDVKFMALHKYFFPESYVFFPRSYKEGFVFGKKFTIFKAGKYQVRDLSSVGLFEQQIYVHPFHVRMK